MYEILFVESIAEDLTLIRAHDRQIILDRIDEQLRHEPTKETKAKKPIVGLKPSWEHEEPLWQLRVGEYRVFYDVNDQAQEVVVRVIRHKPPHKTTEEIL